MQGTRLGEYEILSLIAHGGMADVWLARDSYGRQVALKVLDRERTDDSEYRALFADEAYIATQLAHPNITRTLGYGEFEGRPYLAMEHIDGVDLRGLRNRASAARRTLTLDIAVAIVTAAASALDHAHRRVDVLGRPLNIVHRDVSPSNIMVASNGTVKVIDFGIASAECALHPQRQGMVRGKPAYMSPEQCLGEPVDHRSDVFSLGVVLYELATGERCFSGANSFEQMIAIVGGTWTAPEIYDSRFPPALAEVLRKALQVEAADRYQSAADLVRALEEVAVKQGWFLGPAKLRLLMEQITAPALAVGTAPASPLPRVLRTWLGPGVGSGAVTAVVRASVGARRRAIRHAA